MTREKPLQSRVGRCRAEEKGVYIRACLWVHAYFVGVMNVHASAHVPATVPPSWTFVPPSLPLDPLNTRRLEWGGGGRGVTPQQEGPVPKCSVGQS